MGQSSDIVARAQRKPTGRREEKQPQLMQLKGLWKQNARKVQYVMYVLGFPKLKGHHNKIIVLGGVYVGSCYVWKLPYANTQGHFLCSHPRISSVSSRYSEVSCFVKTSFRYVYGKHANRTLFLWSGTVWSSMFTQGL